MNIGRFLMCVCSLLQTWASVHHGYWYARSAEFLHTPVMQRLRWMRVPGNSIFALNEFTMVWFVLALKRRAQSNFSCSSFSESPRG